MSNYPYVANLFIVFNVEFNHKEIQIEMRLQS